MASGVMQTDTVLDQILAQTVKDVAVRKEQVSELALIERVQRSGRQPLSLHDALDRDHVAVIAEIKRGSPSRGVFPVKIDPQAIAKAYRDGGAAAISCLTDHPFFHGSQWDLECVAEVAHEEGNAIPVLRKDFIVDSYQLLEAKAWGADAVLLIVAALDDDSLRALYNEANELGLSVLVEVHDERETERALRLNPGLLGVNNRNLKTFDVDLHVTERISSLVAPGTLLVSESGVFTAEDVAKVAAWGADAVLVGESLIVQEDREGAVVTLVQVARSTETRARV